MIFCKVWGDFLLVAGLDFLPVGCKFAGCGVAAMCGMTAGVRVAAG